MLDAIVTWLHILGAVVFVGPQIFLAAVAVQAVRGIEDARERQRTLRAVTMGFGILGGAALALLIVTGIYNYAEYDVYIDADNFPRYFGVMQAKLTMVVVVVALTALHGMYFGRRLLQMQEEGAPASEVERMRRWSLAASVLNLAASVAILFFAALLDSDWSKQ